MKSRIFKRLASAGALATSAAVLLGGVAQATPHPIGQSPQFFTNVGANPIRATGSETTFQVMNAIGNLYSQSSIFGCVLSTSDYRTCNVNGDGSATTQQDNWSRNEFINGEGIGSGNGIGQLCGTKPTGGPGTPPNPPALTVDFARASRAVSAGDNCPNAQALQYAVDSVPGLTFPFANIATVPCLAGQTCAATQIGPVAAGWRTGDPVVGPYTGVKLTNISNIASSLLGGESLAYAIYCDTGTSVPGRPSTGHNISDWGQLTDPTLDGTTGATLGSEGLGTSTGTQPIYIPAVNSGSGTYSTWKTFVGCDPNTKNTDAQVAQENDAPQLSDIATADHATDNIAAANQVAETVYYISFGVSQAKPYTRTTSTFGAPGSATQGGQLRTINGVAAGSLVELQGTIATVRGLYNVILPANPSATPPVVGKLRASVAGFLNWICDTNPANHGLDLTTGKNYATEVTGVVGSQFLFPQVACAVDSGGASVPPISAAMISDMNS